MTRPHFAGPEIKKGAVVLKKWMVVLSVILLMLATAGCSAAKEPPAPEQLAGYITIEGNRLYVDRVEIVRSTDTKRIEELQLYPGDMPNGYYIYNQTVAQNEYELTAETMYTFHDLTGVFVKPENTNKLYATTKTGEFLQYLDETYSDDPPAQKVPFWIEVRDGKVIRVTEEWEFTI